MRRVLSALALTASALFVSAGVAGANMDDPLPEGMQCPAEVAGRALDASGSELMEDDGIVVACRYGAGHEVDFDVRYSPAGSRTFGCTTDPEYLSDSSLGDLFDEKVDHNRVRRAGVISNLDHAIVLSWDVLVEAEIAQTRAAGLEFARQAEQYAAPCDASTDTGTGAVPGADAGGTPAGTGTSVDAGTGHGRGSSTPAGVALIGGGLLTTAGGLLLARTKGRSPARPVPVPIEDRIIDGADAIAVLQRAGLVDVVTRPDGTIGYRPVNDLEQFNRHPQWRVTLPNQPVVGAEQIHDLGALGFHERPDGTFDTASIVVGVRPATAPPPAPPAPEGRDLGDQLAAELFTGHLFEETGSPNPERAAEELLDGRPPQPPPLGPAPPIEPPPVAIVDPPAPPPVSAPPGEANPPDHERAYDEARKRRDEGAHESEQEQLTSKHYGWAESAASWTNWLADRSLDVLAKMTGPAGRLVKDVYTVTSKVGQGFGEALVTGDASHIVKGAAEGGIDLLFDKGVDRLQKLDKIPGFRADSLPSPAGSATVVVRQVVAAAHPTTLVSRGLPPKFALRAGFDSWVRETVVRDPVKGLMGF